MTYDKRLHRDNWYDYPNGDEYKLMFDNYHYQDSINNNDFMYQAYNENPNSFYNFYRQYFLFKDIFTDIVENSNSLDIRILIKEFQNNYIVMYVFGPYIEAAAKIIYKHVINGRYTFTLNINNINDSKEKMTDNMEDAIDIFKSYIKIIDGETDVVHDYFPNAKSIYATKGYLK